MVCGGSGGSDEPVCSAHCGTSFCLLLTMVAQGTIALFVMRATAVMNKEWPEAMKGHHEKVLVVELERFWGPVHLLVPGDCDRATYYDEKVKKEMDFCTTVGQGGAGPGYECTFPVKYLGKKYNSCIQRDNPQPWCYVTVDYSVDKDGVGRGGSWGTCGVESGCYSPAPVGTSVRRVDQGDEEEDGKSHDQVDSSDARRRKATKDKADVAEDEDAFAKKQAEFLKKKEAETSKDEVTEAPAEAPTEAPTQAPTEAPTQEQAELLKKEEAETSKDEVTEAPAEAPTEAPAEAPTEAPTQEAELLRKDEAELLKKGVAEAKERLKEQAELLKKEEAETSKDEATEAPAEAPTEAPAEAPTEAPTQEPPDDAPTEQPSKDEATETPKATREAEEAFAKEQAELLKEGASWAPTEEPPEDQILEKRRLRSSKQELPAHAEPREMSLTKMKIPRHIRNVSVCVNGSHMAKDFLGPSYWHRYFSMISLSSMVTGGTTSVEALVASRSRTYMGMWGLLLFTTLIKYGLKMIDMISGCKHCCCDTVKYVQLWNGGRTTVDKLVESLMIHGVSIIFTLGIQLTICTLFLTFWHEHEYFVMSYIPGLGFIAFFVSFVMFTVYVVLDRVKQWMINANDTYIWCFWIMWVFWMLMITVPMLGYCIYVVQFVMQINHGGYIRSQPFSTDFVNASRTVCNSAGYFTGVAIVELLIILKLDLTEVKRN